MLFQLFHCSGKNYMKKQLQRIEIEVGTYKLLKALCVEMNATFDAMVLHKCFGLPLEPRKPINERKYPVDELAVGDSVFIRWPAPIGEPGALNTNPRVAMAIRSYSRRTGKRFAMTGTGLGLTVTRTA